jgi:hypothetical protein
MNVFVITNLWSPLTSDLLWSFFFYIKPQGFLFWHVSFFSFGITSNKVISRWLQRSLYLHADSGNHLPRITIYTKSLCITQYMVFQNLNQNLQLSMHKVQLFTHQVFTLVKWTNLKRSREREALRHGMRRKVSVLLTDM